MEVMCSPDASCSMALFSGIGGNPIDVSAQAPWFQADVGSFHHITSTGGVQDAIDAHFYDGSIDSFEFVTTPEPSSWVLLATLLVGFGVAVKRSFHSSLKMSGSAEWSGLRRASVFLSPHVKNALDKSSGPTEDRESPRPRVSVGISAE
jgi:hypothetical protein